MGSQVGKKVTVFQEELPFFREKPEIIFNDITPDDYKDQAVSYLLEQGENPVNVFHSVRENFFTKTNYNFINFINHCC